MYSDEVDLILDLVLKKYSQAYSDFKLKDFIINIIDKTIISAKQSLKIYKKFPKIILSNKNYNKDFILKTIGSRNFHIQAACDIVENPNMDIDVLMFLFDKMKKIKCDYGFRIYSKSFIIGKIFYNKQFPLKIAIDYLRNINETDKSQFTDIMNWFSIRVAYLKDDSDKKIIIQNIDMFNNVKLEYS